MHEIIDFITGCPEESQTLETIQQAIDEIERARHEALEIRDRLKESKSEDKGG